MNPDERPITESQIDYYTARAPEYDEWWMRQGRYRKAKEHNDAWFREADTLRGWVRELEPRERVLELACGTGNWTEILLESADRLWALDASAAMIAQCRKKIEASLESRHASVGQTTYPIIEFIEANVFAATFPKDLDIIFAGFLFSHIPHEERSGLVRKCLAALRPGGTLAFVDSRSDPLSGSGDTTTPVPEVQRRALNDGRTFDVIKIYDEPDHLRDLFARCGATKIEVRQTERFFWFASCERGH